MRTVFLPQSPRTRSTLSLSSGPGAPMFQGGPQTRIYRAPVRAIGALKMGDTESWGQVLDISLGGCLFKTDDPVEVGAEIEMRVTIVGDDRRAVAELRGIVRREALDGGRPAYGIEFVSSSSEERRVVEWLYSQAVR